MAGETRTCACGCGQPTELAGRTRRGVPKGGPHSYANVQLAHPACNIRKGSRLTVGDGSSS